MKERKFKIKFQMPTGYSKLLHICLIVLSLLGTVMISSASAKTGVTFDELRFAIIKQVIFLVLSYFIMVFVANYFTWKIFANKVTMMILSFGMMVLLLSTRLFRPINGQYNWIQIAGFTLQPSEIAKPVIIGLVAFALGCLPKIRSLRIGFVDAVKVLFSYTWVQILLVVSMIGTVLVIQDDFGTALIMLIICMTMFFVATHPVLSPIQRPLSLILITGLVLAIVVIYTPLGDKILGGDSYQLQRITVIRHMFDGSNQYDSAFQQIMGLYGFARGGWIGTGLGSSLNKLGYLPEPNTDYILSVVVEEIGFLGFLVIALLYILIVYVLFKYAFKVSHKPSQYVLIGAIGYLLAHFILNVGGTTGFLPLTGVPLLLVSSGGTSQIAVLATMGVAQNIIARYTKKMRRKEASRG